MNANRRLEPLSRVATALQVNLHPIDAAHAVTVLPHQLRTWSNQVDRVVLTVDLGQASSGRYKQPGFEESKRKLLTLLDEVQVEFPGVIVDRVDLGDEAQALVRATFFPERRGRYPLRAFDGGPFHVYFYGLARANARYVMHLDSDMMFGGGSQTWVQEAIVALGEVPDALMVAPLGGPPAANGGMDISRYEGSFGRRAAEGQAEARPHYQVDSEITTWSFPTMSTRVFMIDMERFASTIHSLDMTSPHLPDRLRAVLVDQDPTAMPAEMLMSSNMIRRGLRRLDFLGTEPGMYSIHPPYRSAEFFSALPDIIQRIEDGDIADGQRGHYDLHSSMFPWPHEVMHPPRRAKCQKVARQVVDANRRRLTRSRRV